MSRTAGQDIGEQLEQAVQSGCALYLQQRIARLDKIPTPIRQLSRDQAGVFKAVHAKAAHVDFYGVWLERGPCQGQAIAVECKATTAARFPYSGVEPQQRDWLGDTPHAYVLVWFVSLGVTRLVRWRDFPPKSSVGPADGVAADAVRFLAPLLIGRAA
jgi:penicillin-binding protein-related factor A (putative recombinase)